MQKIYTLAEGEAYDASALQDHLNTELSFQTGISSKGKKAFIVYFDEGDSIPMIDNAVASYDFSIVRKDREEKQGKVKAECKNYILSLYPLEIQSSVSLGLYPVETGDEVRDIISLNIEEENRVFDDLELATTVEEIEAINPTWISEVPGA